VSHVVSGAVGSVDANASSPCTYGCGAAVRVLLGEVCGVLWHFVAFCGVLWPVAR
jgi:hypothetical protein